MGTGYNLGKEYVKSAEKLDEQANIQQWIGIGFGVVAVIPAMCSSETSTEFPWGSLLGQISATSVFLFIAAYLLTTASNKKKEAKKYRQASLLSLSLETFVAQMPDEMKQNFRAVIGERLYRPDDADIKVEEESSFFNISKKVKKILMREGTTEKTPTEQ